VVEYFLTENLLAHFNQILLQRSNRRGNVATQVLQTLSILIQNVRNQQTVYYLFSNNHINEIVSMRFDFEDDEVLVSRRRPEGAVCGCGFSTSSQVCPRLDCCHWSGLHMWQVLLP
jgi:hypothetical protein